MSHGPNTESKHVPETPQASPTATATSSSHLSFEAAKIRDASFVYREPRHQVPWEKSILSGTALLHNPKYNKGLAFTEAERNNLRLKGLLPPTIITQDEQLRRVFNHIENAGDALSKYKYLAGLANRNQRLFYRTLIERLETLMPIVYTPTVGLACQRFGHIFMAQSAGLYISLKDKGSIRYILQNWPERRVRCIVFTDGERILGLGDLGAHGMGIPIGKLHLYTACAGIDPNQTLPVTIDVGTDNEEFLNDPLYIGLKQRRDRSNAYDELIDEFITEARQTFGPFTLLQFEDFGNRNAFRLLQKYRDRCCTFNDDIQGTASVVVGGLYAGVKATGLRLSEHTFLIVGAGEAGLGIANLIAMAVAEDENITEHAAREKIWLVDSKGLITKNRPSGGLDAHKNEFAHEHAHIGNDLAAIVDGVQPTAIIGVTAQPNTFSQAVCERMIKYSKNPIIFALSNPTSKAECTAEQAYQWTGGMCFYASGSPFDPVEFNGKRFVPGQGNNAYIFPGLALGVICCHSRRVTDRMMLVAARSLAKQVTDSDLQNGTLYPPFKNIREVSLRIAADVAEEAYRSGLATAMPQPVDLLAFVKQHQYSTEYPVFTYNDA